MSRLLGVACVVVLLVGCAQAAASRAAATCGLAGAPPTPLIAVKSQDDRVRVEYSVGQPVGCAPDAVLITLSSAAKPDNAAPSPTNGLIELTESFGSVELALPPLDLPPYLVRATSLTPRGRRSASATVRIGERCQGTACLENAQEKLERCLRGTAPRATCPAYLWRTRPPIPSVPLQDVTRAALEKSFSARTGTTVVCASTRVCIVGDARFAVSGFQQRPGCWVAESGLNRYHACVDWEWNR